MVRDSSAVLLLAEEKVTVIVCFNRGVVMVWSASMGDVAYIWILCQIDVSWCSSLCWDWRKRCDASVDTFSAVVALLCHLPWTVCTCFWDPFGVLYMV